MGLWRGKVGRGLGDKVPRGGRNTEGTGQEREMKPERVALGMLLGLTLWASLF